MFHQTSGSCSAHPSLNDIIACSFDGSETRSINFPEEFLVNAAFIKEVPISRPTLYMNYAVKYIKIEITIPTKTIERTTSTVEYVFSFEFKDSGSRFPNDNPLILW